MRRRRRYCLPPPVDAEHIVGTGFEFRPEHDRVNAGKPPLPFVELTPVGTAGPVFEFKPEDDKVNSPAEGLDARRETDADQPPPPDQAV